MSQSILLGFILHYITLTPYYIVKDIIQMTSNHKTKNVEEKYNRVKNVNVTINTIRIYTTLYNTYYLLYFKRHNSDDSTICGRRKQ